MSLWNSTFTKPPKPMQRKTPMDRVVMARARSPMKSRGMKTTAQALGQMGVFNVLSVEERVCDKHGKYTDQEYKFGWAGCQQCMDEKRIPASPRHRDRCIAQADQRSGHRQRQREQQGLDAMMRHSTLFLVMAIVLIAPHVGYQSAKQMALVCLALAIVFWAIEMWVNK